MDQLQFERCWKQQNTMFASMKLQQHYLSDLDNAIQIIIFIQNSMPRHAHLYILAWQLWFKEYLVPHCEKEATWYMDNVLRRTGNRKPIRQSLLFFSQTEARNAWNRLYVNFCLSIVDNHAMELHKEKGTISDSKLNLSSSNRVMKENIEKLNKYFALFLM